MGPETLFQKWARKSPLSGLLSPPLAHKTCKIHPVPKSHVSNSPFQQTPFACPCLMYFLKSPTEWVFVSVLVSGKDLGANGNWQSGMGGAESWPQLRLTPSSPSIEFRGPCKEIRSKETHPSLADTMPQSSGRFLHSYFICLILPQDLPHGFVHTLGIQGSFPAFGCVNLPENNSPHAGVRLWFPNLPWSCAWWLHGYVYQNVYEGTWIQFRFLKNQNTTNW